MEKMDSIDGARELTTAELSETRGGGLWDTVKGVASAVATAIYDTTAITVVYPIIDTFHQGPRDAVQSSVYRSYGAVNKFVNNLRALCRLMGTAERSAWALGYPGVRASVSGTTNDGP